MLVDADGFHEHDAGSPFTGLSRAHWIAVADYLLAGSAASIGNKPWNYDFGSPSSVNGSRFDQLEGFSRLLLMAAFRVGADERGVESEWYRRLLAGLEAGARAVGANDPDAWPSPANRDQALVEASSIAIAVSVAPEEFWAPLSDPAKGALVEWFHRALSTSAAWNNWVLFPAAVAAALTRLGFGDETTASIIASVLPTVDPWYRGDGWYADGPGERLDYYSAWSFNYYIPLIAMLADDPQIAAIAAERASAFSLSLSKLVDHRGGPVLFGRSLTYRFGMVAPVWTAGLVDQHITQPGERRALASLVLRHFIDRGAISDGRLPVGWYGSFNAIAQDYTSGASPLWAAKAFVGLLLPATHPLWSAPEGDPSSLTTIARLGRGASFAALAGRGGAAAVLVSGGIPKWPDWSPQGSQEDPLYSRLSYSSVTYPLVEGPLADNEVQLILRDDAVAARAAPRLIASDDTWVSTRAGFRAPGGARLRLLPYRVARAVPALARALRARVLGSRVDILSIVSGGEEVRVARARLGWRGSRIRMTGFALSADWHTDAVGQSFSVIWGSATLEHHFIANVASPFGASLELPSATTPEGAGRALLAVAIALHPVDETPVTASIQQTSARQLTVTMADGSRYGVDVGARSLRAAAL